jgi:hypothetical protein
VHQHPVSSTAGDVGGDVPPQPTKLVDGVVAWSAGAHFDHLAEVRPDGVDEVLRVVADGGDALGWSDEHQSVVLERRHQQNRGR